MYKWSLRRVYGLGSVHPSFSQKLGGWEERKVGGELVLSWMAIFVGTRYTEKNLFRFSPINRLSLPLVLHFLLNSHKFWAAAK